MSASGASAYSLTSFTNNASTTVGGAHPNFTTKLNFDATGTGGFIEPDLTGFTTTLPLGFTLNPEAVPVASRCSEAAFSIDECPLASQIGTLLVTVKVAGQTVPVTIPGNAYLRKPADFPNFRDLETWGIVLRPAKICIPNGFCAIPKKLLIDDHVAFAHLTDSRLRETISGIPVDFVSGASSLNFTVANWQFTRQLYSGALNKGKYFTTNPTGCTAAATTVSVTTTIGLFNGSAPYTPTSCNTNPVSGWTSVVPGETTLDATTSLSLTTSIPTADSVIQRPRLAATSFYLPRGSSFVTTGLADSGTCTAALVNSGTCAANTALGTISATSPQFPEGFSGTFYLTRKTPPYNFSARLNGPRQSGFVLNGQIDVSGEQYTPTSQMQISVTSMPEVPIGSLNVFLNAPRYYLTRGNCTPQPAVTEGWIFGKNSTVMTTTNSYDATPCL